MKQKAKYSKRFLAVLLAMLMLLAAAQPVSFVAAAGNDPDPAFGEGVASARYTTSGTLDISFPEATSSVGNITYYADFYDLDLGYPQRETPLYSGVELSGARSMATDAAMLFAEISAKELETNYPNLDMAHRISIAITAVDGAGWRSAPIEVLVGESVAIPAVGASPAGTDLYAAVTRFEDGYDSAREDGGNHSAGAKYWEYTSDGNGTRAMNIDGVYYNSYTDDEQTPYKHPGFNDSQAFRFYLNGSDRNETGYERFDVMYNQDSYQFTNADELWIWVDTSYVEFEEFALQVRYMDYTGTARYDRDGESGKPDTTTHQYSTDVYSTIGYAARNAGARIPVYYQNENGLWDTMYTNTSGYLENFGHYRGFLRVDLQYLLNEDTASQYKDLWTERPYTFQIQIGYGNWTAEENGDGTAGVNGFWFTGTCQENNIPAETVWKDPSCLSWRWRETALASWKYVTFDPAKFKAATGLSLTTTPINDIASVGFTWRGASEDSMNKPFYIDQIGFSGEGLITNNSAQQPLQSLGMIPSDQEAVNALVEEYLPDPTAVNISDAGVIEDLEAICRQLANTVTVPDKLKQARDRLDSVLDGRDTVSYLHEELQYEKADIAALFDLYQTLTLGELQRLGLQDEAQLVQRYIDAGYSEWYPSALTSLYFLPFNDMESDGYTVGQTALHEFDDYNQSPAGWHYYNHAHNILWDGNYAGAWENTKNLIAYSRQTFDSAETEANDADPRFGLAATTIGQNGFANSRSVDTRFFRDVLADSENYRISLTANGQNVNNWNELTPVNIGTATDIIFYADFSEMTDIRKLWITLRTSDGSAYSHDEDDTSPWEYQVLDMEDDQPQWEPRQSDNGNDGCLAGSDLQGFRGFIKIPLSHFYEVQDDGNPGQQIPQNSDVKQIKVFYTGAAGGTDQADRSMSLDMFGFVNTQPFTGAAPIAPDTQLTPPSFTATTVEAVRQQILDLYEDVTLLGAEQASTDYLFNYTDATNSAYSTMLAAYHTLTLTEKEQLATQLPSNVDIADMAAFVRNYEPYGGVDGNLKKYVANANSLYTTVTGNFGKTALSAEEKNNVVSALNTYENYPAKYQNTVLTYWADRNLSAVFPNFTVKTDDIAENTQDTPLITMKLDDEAGTTYTGTGALPFYAAAAANPYDVRLEIPSTVTLSMDDEKITVPITGQVISPADPGTMNFSLSIAETDVQNSGVYTGSFNVTLETPVADRGTGQSSNPLGSGGVPDAEDYRMETYTVYVKLICEASYTVVIPADTTIEWFETSEVPVGEGVRVEDVRIPSNAAVQVDVDSDGEYALTKDGNKIPYLLNGETSSLSHTFNASNFDAAFSLNVLVNSMEDWLKVPAEEENYQDVLNFTVTYRENA
ncbi:MAG TPA: hypothetical protein IAD07_02455 [Candidatus Fimivicinus intestinavium]|nr:hypothetical protein [Candidatus Fimivicinus intestinavium]